MDVSGDEGELRGAGNRWLRAFSVTGQDLGKNKDFGLL